MISGGSEGAHGRTEVLGLAWDRVMRGAEELKGNIGRESFPAAPFGPFVFPNIPLLPKPSFREYCRKTQTSKTLDARRPFDPR
jgi:hypothetical protein